MKRILTVLVVSVVAIAFFSCKKNNDLEQQRKNELALLDEYIDINYPGAVPKPSGLYYF